MNLKDKLVKEILDKTKYSGSLEPETKQISASSYDLEPMQLYLRYKYGDIERDEDLNATHLGSVLQLGFDQIFTGPKYITAYRQKRILPNGWTVSGEIDLIDIENKAIIDFKLLSGAGYKKAIKKDSYISNMSIYRWLFNNDYPNSYLFAFNKAGSSVRGDQYEIVDLTDSLWDFDLVEEALVSKTNEIQYMIDNPNEIPECNIYEYGRNKEKLPNKCQYYCSFRDICPIYKKMMKANGYKKVKNLL